MAMNDPSRSTREIVYGDAIAWLEARPAMPGTSVVASVPDVSEVGISLDAWRGFFTRAVRAALTASDDAGVVFFFQTDIKREGRVISKAAMVLREAEEVGVPLLWHKIVCRRAPGLATRGRPAFSHFFAFSRSAVEDPMRATADVLPDLGFMPWSHSMGTRAAELAMSTIRSLSPSTSRVIVPFCGIGTAVAVANRYGFDAVGIERNKKRAHLAEALQLDETVHDPLRSDDGE